MHFPLKILTILHTDMAIKNFKGKRIFLTRSDNSKLAEVLKARGAEVVEMPLIKVEYRFDADDMADILEEVGHYDWITFSSVHGVKGFFNEFFKVFKDIRNIGISRIACVGETTANEVRKYYLNPDVVPSVYDAKTMIREMSEFESLDNLRILCVSGNLSNNPAFDDLEKKYGAIVDKIVVYHTSLIEVKDDFVSAKSFREKGADAIVFCSPSAVEAFAKSAKSLQLSAKAVRPKIVAIGETTAESIKKFGMKPAVVAELVDIESALEKVL